MKTALLALPLLLVAAPTLAMDDHATEASADALSLDTPIETLMADEDAREVVLAEIPGLDEHEHYMHFKSMSLAAIQPMSGGMITDEMLANIAAGLAELD
ncbi:hypothetical protein [Alteriqipengyuania lutimaris]|uniref:Uncharacterized protein n=1 Tax=Alteriqipengyuania lutimaris TaxID=1538146 RepID=A0A395LMI0_9SPHN|nr:hypothetical protein [Alteriqipengyuania lutimaris]MBB3034408.1 hypothetical protein [Alteriqipengyuania lutimaris]RDS76694.1 hypothetical protein DL238_03120 [Alteriqipengyuania lutimaris]